MLWHINNERKKMATNYVFPNNLLKNDHCLFFPNVKL